MSVPLEWHFELIFALFFRPRIRSLTKAERLLGFAIDAIKNGGRLLQLTINRKVLLFCARFEVRTNFLVFLCLQDSI